MLGNVVALSQLMGSRYTSGRFAPLLQGLCVWGRTGRLRPCRRRRPDPSACPLRRVPGSSAWRGVCTPLPVRRSGS